MEEQVYKVEDPSGKIREIIGPTGASEEEIIAKAQELFSSTEGGAVTGIQKPPDPQREIPIEKFGADVGGAGVFGAVGGVAAPYLLKGAGDVLSSMPFPGARVTGLGLKYAGEAAGNVPAKARASTGLIGGLISETAGKFAEGFGAGPVAAEAVRFIAGGVTPEFARLAYVSLGRSARLLIGSQGISGGIRADRIVSAIDAAAKDIEQRNGKPLTDEQRAYFSSLAAELAGNKKPGEALEQIAPVLSKGSEKINADAKLKSDNLYTESFKALDGANEAAQTEINDAINNAKRGVKGRSDAISYLTSLKNNIVDKSKEALTSIGNPRDISEIGSDLQNISVARQTAERAAATNKYNETKVLVDKSVSDKESAGVFVNSLPEYKSLVSDLKKNTRPGVRSTDVSNSFQRILDNIKIPTDKDGKPTEKGSYVSFQAIDDARRLLGEVFRGNPPDGYAAIDAATAREYYAKLSNIQKIYAGKKQSELLDNYALSKEGLEVFNSQYGRKIAGRDPGDLDQLKSDPASIPSYFFKSPKSFNSLISLVGEKEFALSAAKDYVANEISSKTTSRQINLWLTQNRDFMSAVPEVRNSVIQYRNSLEKTERTLLNLDNGINTLTRQQTALPGQLERAAERRSTKLVAGGELQAAALQEEAKVVTKEAADAANKVFNSSVGPLKNVRALIENGDINTWSIAAPIITRSPDAKGAVFDAVRQIVSELPVAGSQRKFQERISPALLKFDMITKEQSDFITAQLGKIEASRLPSDEKLSLTKRLILDAAISYSSTLGSRSGSAAAFSLVNLIPK
jgi:hypothetical protein